MFFDCKKILTVSELTQCIKQQIEDSFEKVWVEGEVSNVRTPSSGHYYFTLKDDRSQIKAVIFRFMGRFLKFKMQDGLSIICRGKVAVYEPRGEYQLIIDYVEPKGVGALQLAFEQLREKLRKEGLFDPSHKKPLPVLPRTIGIVTSPSGAALRDLLKVIHRRFPNVGILVNPVRVQGDGAAQEIACAIEELNQLPEDIDVIIVARGGGSLEDLWPFNEEVVARAIYHSKIPIISAVGHEIDFTIADFVADLRAPTPSVAGELVVREKSELVCQIQSLSERMEKCVMRRLESLKTQHSFFRKRLPDMRFRISELQLRVDDASGRLVPHMRHAITLRWEMLKGTRGRFFSRHPAVVIKEYLKNILLYQVTLTDCIRLSCTRMHQLLDEYLRSLSNLSPLQVLKRGYSITRKLPSYRIVKDSSELDQGERVNILLAKGEVFCQVEKTVL